MDIEQLKKLCGVCGNEHSYSDAVCERKHFACGACGEWINEDKTHNCSEETQLAECVECFADFDPFKEGKIHDKFSAPNLGGAVVAFCGKCWKKEIARRNGGN